MSNHFNDIKSFLSRLRKWEVNILEDTEYRLIFCLINDRTEKYFNIVYADSDHEIPKVRRPYWHYYYCSFEESNVFDRRIWELVDVTDTKWKPSEEEVIYWIKNRQKIGK